MNKKNRMNTNNMKKMPPGPDETRTKPALITLVSRNLEVVLTMGVGMMMMMMTRMNEWKAAS